MTSSFFAVLTLWISSFLSAPSATIQKPQSFLVKIPVDVLIESVQNSQPPFECIPATNLSVVENDICFANRCFADAGVVFYIRSVGDVDFVPEIDFDMPLSGLKYHFENVVDGRILVVYGYSSAFDRMMGITYSGQKIANGPVVDTIKISNRWRISHVLAHEFGHVLNLGHSFDNVEGFSDVVSFHDGISDPIGFFDQSWTFRNVMNYWDGDDVDFSEFQKNWIRETRCRFLDGNLPGFP